MIKQLTKNESLSGKDLTKVPYRKYLEFEGVRDSIREVKKTKKEDIAKHLSKTGRIPYGYELEEAITSILSKSEDLEIKALPPQMDVGFGADLQISYKENGKNYSFFLDITCSRKPIYYLSLSGDLSTSAEDAFAYRTENFTVRFGFKERHVFFFFYEKPVVVLNITPNTDNEIPSQDIADTHVYNIANMMKSVNSYLVKKGFGARASQNVRPNLNAYRKDIKRYQHEIRASK